MNQCQLSDIFENLSSIGLGWNLNELMRLSVHARAKILENSMWRALDFRIKNFESKLNLEIDLDLVSKLSFKCKDIDPHTYQTLMSLIKDLIPWRKGPFDLFGHYVDSEWRSDLKWDRISSTIGNIKDLKVLDVGCNNGYYLFRMVPRDPALLIGFDPSPLCMLQFELINSLIKATKNFRKSSFFYPLGIEHVDIFDGVFDLVLCMGVLYHRRDPLGSLSQLFGTLKAGGGRLLLETLIVGEDEPYTLCPLTTYAGMSNVWFLPSKATLLDWLTRVGFKKLKIVSDINLDINEQRVTEYSSPVSLVNFLDSKDTTKTIEGYPSPRRIVVECHK